MAGFSLMVLVSWKLKYRTYHSALLSKMEISLGPSSWHKNYFHHYADL